MHDVRKPGSRANVDHIAVAPSGIHIIDAKNYTGKVHTRRRGPFFHQRAHLYVGTHDRTSLIEKLHGQVIAIDQVTRDLRLPTPVTAVLCFVKAEWGKAFGHYELDGVHVLWPKRLVKVLDRPGPFGPTEIATIGEHLVRRLTPA